MATWMSPNVGGTSNLPSLFNKRTDRHLRILDVVLATLALLLLALPLGLGWLVGRIRAVPCAGSSCQSFYRWRFDFPATLVGRLLEHLGIARWPVLFNILVGEMAWVGPKPRMMAAQAIMHPGLMQLRPGLVNIWDLRQRTAVDFGTELDADLEYLCNRGVRHDLGLLLRAGLVAWLPHTTVSSEPRTSVGDVVFDNIDMTQAIARLSAMIDGPCAQQVIFVNPACVNIAAHDRGYRRILARAAMVLPDGIGIKIAADILGRPLKQNVNGTDLFPRLCDMLELRGGSLFLLGGQPGIVEKVAQAVREQWPNLRIAGLRDGFFGVAQEGEVAAEVSASKADILLVARGVPMQDIFIDRQLHQLDVKVAIGVGGLFDFVSGRINRAPAWMRDTGLEWVYRFMQEPSRMWQRYLVGNFTFLGRIVLQRVGLRQPANDSISDESVPAPLVGQGMQGLRTVLFATSTATQEIPVSSDFPSALLPFGCSTFIERALDQLAEVGVRQVDLVVSARPEALRRLLGQGERWGIQLRWHLAKDAATPYGVLRSMGLEPTDRVLLGHADRWIAADALAVMVQQTQVLAHTDPEAGVKWTGWGFATPEVLATLSSHIDEAALGECLCRHTTHLQMLEAIQFVEVRNAVELLKAQQLALTEAFLQTVPASWLRTTWGAYSPDAVLEAGAVIEGPVLIGAGCFVAAGAQVGPGTVLTCNVVVSAESVVRNSLVLPQTFIGHGLELDETLVNAQSVQHLRLGVRTVLKSSEGLLLDLQHKNPISTSWLARTTALIACLVSLPWLALDLLIRRVRGLPLRWVKRLVVVGRDVDSTNVRLQSLRCAQPSAGSERHLLSNYGAWMDVVAGHRSWFGARPRSLSEWYAIGRDWQLLLVNTPVGCLHAPAWSDGLGESQDAQAAADVFFAVSQGVAERMRILAVYIFRRKAGCN